MYITNKLAEVAANSPDETAATAAEMARLHIVQLEAHARNLIEHVKENEQTGAHRLNDLAEARIRLETFIEQEYI